MPKFVSVSYACDGVRTDVGNLRIDHLLEFFMSLRGTKFDTLAFADCEITEDEMSMITPLIPGGLMALEMNRMGIGPGVMKVLSKSLMRSRLESLDLSDNPIGDGGAWILLEFIGKNKNLRSLNVARCQVSCSAVFALLTALSDRELDVVDMSGNIIHAPGVEYISEFLGCDPRIRDLRLNNCSLSAGDVEYLVDAALKCVRCKGISLTGNGFIAWRELPEHIRAEMTPRML